MTAEELYESIGGDLCICQRQDVSHWCEKCQWRISVIAGALSQVAAPTPVKPLTYGGHECHDSSPPWFTGRWRDWHRGHRCRLDDGKPRSEDGQKEIDAHAAL